MSNEPGRQSQKGLRFGEQGKPAGPVECLGLQFPSEEARRAHFTDKLREKLKDKTFRSTPGFPQGTDEAILRMSDPPYYTACPNPFLGDFVRVHGRPWDPKEKYEREPFAVDVSEGKTDQLYKAHGYHTKVPHLAIVPSILHYTEPGDLVLDGFCGSGMTGLAAQLCGTAPGEYRRKLEMEWKGAGHAAPKWGARRAVLNDLGPAASFIAAGYNLPFDVERFEREAQRILGEVEQELGWMYETLHRDGKTKGRINYTVWSEVFSCPQCGGEINFVAEALDEETKKTREELSCPSCKKTGLDKDTLERLFESRLDPATGETCKRIVLRPVMVNYSVGGVVQEKPIGPADLQVLRQIEGTPFPAEVPAIEFPFDDMWEASRLREKGITRAHHLFLDRPARILALLWRKAKSIPDTNSRRMVLWFVEQAIWGMSVLARYAPTHYSQVNQYLSGALYVGSQIVDVSPWYILHDSQRRSSKLLRLSKCFTPMPAVRDSVVVQTGDCGSIPAPDKSIDYVFTDPPFGDNFAYWELNFLVESWHGVLSDGVAEAAVDRSKANRSAQKSLHDYQRLMTQCFAEYYRVLKPGRWMTSSSATRAMHLARDPGGDGVRGIRRRRRAHARQEAGCRIAR
jgi:hypothetical protein